MKWNINRWRIFEFIDEFKSLNIEIIALQMAEQSIDLINNEHP